MKIKIEYGNFKVEIEGTEKEIDIGINSFLENIHKIHQLQEIKPIQKAKTFAGSITERVELLITEGFFDQPRQLSEIKQKLEELGYNYPVTTIAPVLLFLLRQNRLGRVGKKRNYAYVRHK